MTSRAAATAVAMAADRLIGEPPARWHPVARFGQAMERAERSTWADRRTAGVRHAALGVGLAAMAGWLAERGGPRQRTAALTTAVYVAVAQQALVRSAQRVGDALDAGDIAQARARVQEIVGRDTARLDEGGIVRAAVESVAENTVDAVTAPLIWALAGGAPAVLGYRAANTLDAMVGHRNARYERFGWASARIDDAANWLPARLTAGIVAGLRPWRAAAIGRAIRRDAPAHPSPNAGVVEAAFAAALGLRLGGTNVYGGRVDVRPELGDGRTPDISDIAAACRLSRQVGAATCGLGLLVAAARARP